MKKYYTTRELTKLHEAAVLLILNGLITDGQLQQIKSKLLKLSPQK